MKKLFGMILMLSISLPAWAGDVNLICTLKSKHGTVSHEKFTFNADEGKVISSYGTSYIKAEYSCPAESRRNCFITEITDTTVWQGHWNNRGGSDNEYALDRIDGSIRFYNRNEEEASGTCIPFKQAF
jgi:hypothetical protein